MKEGEEAVVLDRAGNPILRKKSETTELTFNDAEEKQMEGRVLVHNHPTGRAFSPDDMELAAKGKVAQLRVVGSKYTHVLKPPLAGWETVDREAIPAAYKEEETAAVFRLTELLYSGKLRESEFNDRLDREVSEAMAKRFGFRYERQRR